MLLRRALQGFEREFLAKLSERGYTGFRAKHGAVFVTIDTEGSRITDLALRADLSKPAMLDLVDELEKLGHVIRIEHSDRRAKLIKPTRTFVGVLEQAAVVIAEIEHRYRRAIGNRRYELLRSTLVRIAGSASATDVEQWGTLWRAGRIRAAIPDSAGPDIGILLLLALRVFEKDAFRALRDAGYALDRRRHLLVLNLLSADGSRATEVAQRAGISKPAIGKVLDDLQERGYIRREGDPADRRAKTVVLTRRGFHVLRDSRNIFATLERRHLRPLGPAQAKTLRRALLAISAGD